MTIWGKVMNRGMRSDRMGKMMAKQDWRLLGWRLMGGSLTGAMLVGVACAALWMSAPQAMAETASNPLEGFATDPNQPVEIEADRLEVEDKSQTATFIGNVVAVQGMTRLRSDRLKATYSQAKDGERAQVRQIIATGRVHVLSKDDQSADGDWARYDVVGRTIVMGDKVVLRQGQNVIRGTKLTIDLNSGRSQVSGGQGGTTSTDAGNGRVKALFQPSPSPKK